MASGAHAERGHGCASAPIIPTAVPRDVKPQPGLTFGVDPFAAAVRTLQILSSPASETDMPPGGICHSPSQELATRTALSAQEDITTK